MTAFRSGRYERALEEYQLLISTQEEYDEIPGYDKHFFLHGSINSIIIYFEQGELEKASELISETRHVIDTYDITTENNGEYLDYIAEFNLLEGLGSILKGRPVLARVKIREGISKNSKLSEAEYLRELLWTPSLINMISDHLGLSTM